MITNKFPYNAPCLMGWQMSWNEMAYWLLTTPVFLDASMTVTPSIQKIFYQKSGGLHLEKLPRTSMVVFQIKDSDAVFSTPHGEINAVIWLSDEALHPFLFILC